MHGQVLIGIYLDGDMMDLVGTDDQLASCEDLLVLMSAHARSISVSRARVVVQDILGPINGDVHCG